MIIGWFCLHPSLGDVVAVASQGRFVFFVTLRCCRRCLAGAFFFVLFRNLTQKGHNWSKKVISGPDVLKNDDSWSDFITLDLLSFDFDAKTIYYTLNQIQ